MNAVRSIQITHWRCVRTFAVGILDQPKKRNMLSGKEEPCTYDDRESSSSIVINHSGGGARPFFSWMNNQKE